MRVEAAWQGWWCSRWSLEVWGNERPSPSLLAPAQIGAGLDVLAVDAGQRLGGDQRHAGVGVAADLLAGLAQLVALGLGRGEAKALEEAVVALRAHRVAGEQIERGDPGRLAAQRRLGVLADEHAGLVVVGGEQRVGGLGRVGRAVQRD